MKSILRSIAQSFAIAGGAVALLLAMMTMYSVVQRFFTSKPIPGDIELMQFGIALSISLCLAWCQLQGANIIVDFFTQRNKPSTNRVLDGIGCVLLAVMYLLLAWRTTVGAQSVKRAMETTMTLELPMWWTYSALAPGLALAALVALVQAWMHFSQQDMSALSGTATEEISA